VKTLKLNDKIEIPILGLGTWQLKDQGAIEHALEVGYRLIDTADIYNTHIKVGRAVKNSKIPREDLFLTTKIWYNSLNRKAVEETGKRFLDELQTPYIDLLLIHWPNPAVPIRETLEAMNSLKEQGVTHAIGVSNFEGRRLEEALKTGVEITNNQVELHPSFNQRKLKSFCDAHKIVVTAYSPIARGQDLNLEEIKTLAKKYAKTPSQIILNWIAQQDIVAIPKAATHKHIEENFNSLDFNLSKEDRELINQVPQEPRLINPGFADFDH